MYFFTADQHFDHANIIKYCHRPFSSAKEMNEAIIDNHNSVVKPGDTVFHLGDIAFVKSFYELQKLYLDKLNGKHVLIRGNHDYWADGRTPSIIEAKVSKQKIVCCHYSMHIWNRSHHNAWHLFGHSHGLVTGIGKSFDVGVDAHNFTPVSFDQVSEIMKTLPDNPDRIDYRR